MDGRRRFAWRGKDMQFFWWDDGGLLIETLSLLMGRATRSWPSMWPTGRRCMRRSLMRWRTWIGAASYLVGVFANAGIGGANAYDVEGESDRWEEILRVNVTGVYVTLQECRSSGGGRAGSDPCGGHVQRAWAFRCARLIGVRHVQTAVLGLVRSLAVEWGREGILVNAICPGWVETDMARKASNAWRRHRASAMPNAMLGAVRGVAHRQNEQSGGDGRSRCVVDVSVPDGHDGPSGRREQWKLDGIRP